MRNHQKIETMNGRTKSLSGRRKRVQKFVKRNWKLERRMEEERKDVKIDVNR